MKKIILLAVVSSFCLLTACGKSAEEQAREDINNAVKDAQKIAAEANAQSQKALAEANNIMQDAMKNADDQIKDAQKQIEASKEAAKAH